MNKVDLLIVGQGIAGSVLSYQALQMGKTVAIVDTPLAGRSSYVAGGLINPVTGRRVKKSWNYEMFYESLFKTYAELDQLLGIKSFHSIPIYRLLATFEDVNNWEVQRTESEYIDFMDSIVSQLDERIAPHSAAGVIKKGGWVDTVKFLDAYKSFLKSNHLLIEEEFEYSQLESHQYKSIHFENIIFSEGYQIRNNPFFPEIELWSTKGETLVIEIEGDDFDYILNKNMLLIPMGNHQYKVGATLERNEDVEITEKGLSELKEKIESVLQVPYKIIQQDAGIRPNVRDRKPLIGSSKDYPNYYVFNGLGSKGVSLAPYFSQHLLNHIYLQEPLMKEVNWQRILPKS
ncbi:MAG TPA: FAD-binding oxidoreductase [Chitinophagales bacterium]|nr:FAD-binding oxidoreductase [Chitinophagales bacterium]